MSTTPALHRIALYSRHRVTPVTRVTRQSERWASYFVDARSSAASNRREQDEDTRFAGGCEQETSTQDYSRDIPTPILTHPAPHPSRRASARASSPTLRRLRTVIVPALMAVLGMDQRRAQPISLPPSSPPPSASGTYALHGEVLGGRRALAAAPRLPPRFALPPHLPARSTGFASSPLTVSTSRDHPRQPGPWRFR